MARGNLKFEYLASFLIPTNRLKLFWPNDSGKTHDKFWNFAQ